MDWNLPNKITLVRIMLIPVFAVVLLGGFLDEHTARQCAVFIFILASATDFLDGYIARSRGLITDLGKFMDPLADKLLVAAALVAMVQLGDLPAWVVITILSREFIITGFRTVAAGKNVVMAADGLGKAKTVVQMAMIVVVLLNIGTDTFNIIGYALVVAAVVLTVVSGAMYIWKNIIVLK